MRSRLGDRRRRARMGPSGLSRFGVLRGLRGLLGVPVCLAVIALMVGASAARASAWVVQSVPAPTLPAGHLSAVSCPSAGWCMAVGSGPNGSFAERWEGGSWAMQGIAKPSMAQLSSISCSSATACTAVGSIGAGAKSVVLAERWNGTGWAVQAAPRRSAAGESLGGVSCPTRRFCVAVGSSVTQRRSKGLVELWKGSRWAIERTLVRGARARAHDYLTDVSCPSAKACVAVGAGIAGSWNGSRWSLQGLKNNRTVVFDAVSCSSDRACVAIGTSNWARWIDRRWRVHRLPDFGAVLGGDPNGATFPSISCVSATTCIAVGSYSAANALGGPLAVMLRGDRWSLQALPATGLTTPYLAGVSCTSASNCTTVGESAPPRAPAYTLAMHWNGQTWSTEETPSQLAPTPAHFNGVSCPSQTSCTAVGDYLGENGLEPFAEGWNGSTWSIQNTPTIPGLQDSWLSGVSCTSAAACVAVGSINGAGQLAFRWDGNQWTELSTTGLGDGVLSGVSCTSADACTAVGNAPSSPPNYVTTPLAERWNGTTWTLEDVPSPSSGPHVDASLTAVSCSASMACVALGQYGPLDLQQFAEGWDGTRWSLQTTPPTPGSTAVPTSVSCTSPNACVAVLSGTPGLVVEQWDGSAWTIQTLPPAPNVSSSGGEAVSCTSPSQCTAVGGSATFAPPGSADVWNGAVWAAQSLPTIPGVSGLDLSAVSCTSANVCTAVGDDGDAGGYNIALLAIRSN